MVCWGCGHFFLSPFYSAGYLQLRYRNIIDSCHEKIDLFRVQNMIIHHLLWWKSSQAYQSGKCFSEWLPNFWLFWYKRLPGCLVAVLPSFEKSLILLPLYNMTHGWANYQLGLPMSLPSYAQWNSINNSIKEYRNLGNTASIQPGSLYSSRSNRKDFTKVLRPQNWHFFEPRRGLCSRDMRQLGLLVSSYQNTCFPGFPPFFCYLWHTRQVCSYCKSSR